MYSAYPFPNRGSRKLDAFGEDALAFFDKDPDGVFVKSEELGGKSVVRVAVADRMASDACVTCHNTHPDSPKKDWKLKDVRGALEVVVPIDGQLEATTSMMGTIALVLARRGTGRRRAAHVADAPQRRQPRSCTR